MNKMEKGYDGKYHRRHVLRAEQNYALCNINELSDKVKTWGRKNRQKIPSNSKHELNQESEESTAED